MGRGSSSGGGSRGSSSSSSRGSSSSSRSSGSSRSWISSDSSISGGVRNYITIIIFSLILLTIGIVQYVDAKKYLPTNAVCVENKLLNDYYYTTYEYEIDGIEYRNRSQEGWELPEIIGETVVIYYLKDNPNYITEKEQPTTINIVFIIIGVELTVVYGFLLVKNIKKEQQKKQEKEQEIKKYATCVYCGGKCEITDTKCSNCGAARINEESEEN